MAQFNELNGLTKMVELLKLSEWKVKALVLDTIPKLYAFQSTITHIQQNSQILIIMWEQINSKNAQVKRLALNNFIQMASQEQGTTGFGYILKAASNYARRQGKSPYSELVNCLNVKEKIEVRFLALQLINCLIVKSPSEKKTSQFLARLENIGLYNELTSLSELKTNAAVVAQLQNFQISTKQLLPSL